MKFGKSQRVERREMGVLGGFGKSQWAASWKEVVSDEFERTESRRRFGWRKGGSGECERR